MKLTKSLSAQVRFHRCTRARRRGGFWVSLLIYVVLFVAAELLRPKPDIENAKPAGIGDFRFPTATEQRHIPLVWGTVRIDGPNVVWYGDLRFIAITESVKTGLWSRERITKGYKYFMSVQHALCEGDVDELTGAWVGDDFVGDYSSSPIEHLDFFTINEPTLFGGDDEGQGGFVGTFQFFSGIEDQLPSDYLSASSTETITIVAAGSGYEVEEIITVNGGVAVTGFLYGTVTQLRVDSVDGSGGVTGVELIAGGRYTSFPGIATSTTSEKPGGGGTGLTVTVGGGAALQSFNGVTPGYQNLCYVCDYTDPAYIGNSHQPKQQKWEVGRFPNGLSLTGGKERVDGGANPANVFFEILTNDFWAHGQPSSDIDTASFTAAADTLFTEGQGFRFILDRPEDIGDLVRRLEEQIDGILNFNRLTAKWELKLIRDDYDINTVPEVNATNLLSLESFTRSSYEGTSNEVRVPTNDPNDDYKATYGFAQDMANVRIQGKSVPVSLSRPGAMGASLANGIAWAKLRTLSIPLAQGEFLVDRSLYGLQPGDVFGFTHERLSFTRLPMRIKSIDYGDYLDGLIRIEAVQDVFQAAVGRFTDNPTTLWVSPGENFIAFPSVHQVAFETPRAIEARNPASVTAPEVDTLYAAARKVGPESGFEIRERNSSGPPAGSFSKAGSVNGFMLIGQLDTALGITTSATTTVTLRAQPDTQASLETAIEDVTNVQDLGVDLVNLLYVQTAAGEGEFMLATSAQNSGGDVQLNSVYRGVLDSVQRSHAAGAYVYLIGVGSGGSDDQIPAGNNVDIKLIPFNGKGSLDEADATTIQIVMGNRTRSPYPPSSFDLNSTTLDETLVNLDGSGSGEDVGVLVDEIHRRDFRTTNEVSELGQDAADIHADFPTANSTTVEVEVRNGASVLASTVGLSGTSTTMRQLDILQGLGTTSLPSSLTFAVRQSHTFEGTVYKSRVWLEVISTISSEFVGKHAFGVLDNGDEGAVYLVQSGDDSTDHVFNLSSSFTTGDVEYELDNNGTWVTLIASGGTGPGTIPNGDLSVGTEIRIRHNSTDTTPQKLLGMTVGGAEEAYAVLIS